MRYTTDLTDTEWNLISYCFPKPAATGRPRKHSYRELLNAVCYLLRTGCQWRNLLTDLPPWPTVYDYFRQWERTELIADIHTQLRDHMAFGCTTRSPSRTQASPRTVRCLRRVNSEPIFRLNGRRLSHTAGLALGLTECSELCTN
jgi:transposase